MACIAFVQSFAYWFQDLKWLRHEGGIDAVRLPVGFWCLDEFAAGTPLLSTQNYVDAVSWSQLLVSPTLYCIARDVMLCNGLHVARVVDIGCLVPFRFDWAEKHGLKVLLELHGLVGSQNGEHHSGDSGQLAWLQPANRKKLCWNCITICRFIISYQSYLSKFIRVRAPTAHYLELVQDPNVRTWTRT